MKLTEVLKSVPPSTMFRDLDGDVFTAELLAKEEADNRDGFELGIHAGGRAIYRLRAEDSAPLMPPQFVEVSEL